MLAPDGTLLGVVDALELELAINDRRPGVTGADVLRHSARVRADDTLEAAIETLAASGEEGLPVLAAQSDQLIGWLTHRNLLQAYARRLRTGQAAMSSRTPAVSGANGGSAR